MPPPFFFYDGFAFYFGGANSTLTPVSFCKTYNRQREVGVYGVGQRYAPVGKSIPLVFPAWISLFGAILLYPASK